MSGRAAALTVAGLALATSVAHADRVIDRRSSWSDTRIVTDVVIEKTDGSIETRRLPGGSVDGIGMVEFPLGVASPGAGLLGWVPARTSAGKPIAWRSSCVYVTPSVVPPSDIPAARVGAVLDAAIGEWNGRTRTCSFLKLFRATPSAVEVGLDGTNLLVFREDRWCRPATVCDPNDCHDADAAALTTIFFVDKPGAPDDGVILDTDIEINAVDFAVWDEGATEGTGPGADLQNTLTHELGHVVGLGHTCWDEDGPPDLDGDNLPIPRCGSNPAEITEATMFNYQDSGPPPETIKRSLEADDIQGFCTRYPPADDPRECRRTAITPRLVGGTGCLGGGECVVAGRGATARGAWLVIGLAVVALRRRRRR